LSLEEKKDTDKSEGFDFMIAPIRKKHFNSGNLEIDNPINLQISG
jgi:hypothetical protein